MTATEITSIIEAFGERLEATEGAVATFSEYRPNGGIAQWTTPIVPADGFDATAIDPDTGTIEWDAAEISADGLSLKLSRTPDRGVHVYHEWAISNAADYSAELLAAFAGPDGIDSLSSLRKFADWLDDAMDLPAGSEAYNEAMLAALEDAKRLYR